MEKYRQSITSSNMSTALHNTINNNQLIPEQRPNEQNPMFQLLYNQYHMLYPTLRLN